MAKKGSPYLESGESLILTTDRISVNSVQYDMLLTTRYLILVDVRYAQFQPQMIPLLTIQSVKGGKTANGELVITLFHRNRQQSWIRLNGPPLLPAVLRTKKEGT
jgi:hypothetical protein